MLIYNDREHLYRYHRVYQCPRCKEPFKLEKEFQHHSEAAEACESKPMKAVEGITDQIEKLLHNRKKAYRGQTEKERWEEIYKILFPFDKVPSPYFEPIQEQPHRKNNLANAQPLADYEAYVRRELPRFFRAELETAVNDEVGPIEERLMNQIMDMYQTCQEQRSHTTTSRLGEEASEVGEGILRNEQGLGEFSAKTTLLGDVEDLADSIMTFQPPPDSLPSPSTQNLKKLTQVTACDHFSLTEGSEPSYHQKDFASLWHPNSSRPFPNESTIDSIAEEHKFFNTEHLSQLNPGGANSSMSVGLWKLCKEVMPSNEDFITDTPIFPKELDKASSCIEAQGNFDWESFLNVGTLADVAR
ncbi:hypothetical protein B0O99DRAFT_711740 [Bisporella sp. PMI_857]|nr:hypothetical protein B0O99DRAFT_711740 [Bisporella sp. PMI_857]